MNRRPSKIYIDNFKKHQNSITKIANDYTRVQRINNQIFIVLFVGIIVMGILILAAF